MRILPILSTLFCLALASCSKSPAPEAPAAESPKAEAPKAETAPAAPSITHLDAAGSFELLKEQSDVTVLDVRTAQEYAAGRLTGAVNIDYRADGFKEAVLAKLDKKKPYLLHCQGGGRSSSALDLLEQLGFEKLYHLDGGLSAWTDGGYPVEE